MREAERLIGAEMRPLVNSTGAGMRLCPCPFLLEQQASRGALEFLLRRSGQGQIACQKQVGVRLKTPEIAASRDVPYARFVTQMQTPAYLPFQFGFLLEAKASTPSRASSEVHRSAKTSLLCSNRCRKGRSIVS